VSTLVSEAKHMTTGGVQVLASVWFVLDRVIFVLEVSLKLRAR
jgi:hypothetical protein